MTGFGRGEGETGLGKVYVESRSVNHRYCDISVKLPRLLVPFEGRVKEMARMFFSRGKIDISLKLDHTGEGRVQLAADLYLAQQYLEALRTLKERLQLQGEITLEIIAGAKELIVAKEELEDVEPYWERIVPILKESFSDMDHMKRVEGESLARDLQQRWGRIAEQLGAIKQRFPLCLEAYREKLLERLRALLGEVDPDTSRFQQEVAFLAERTDITEEIVRADSHLAQFRAFLNETDPVGRKMDFLVQEIHREVNTISAKANDAEISQRVVEIKSELEKVREQVQNIE